MAGTVTERRNARGSGQSRGRDRCVLAAVGLLVLLLPLAATASAATAWDPTPTSWTNGTVLCEFSPNLPMVSVSALSRSDTGLTASVLSLAEVGPTGTLVAAANLSASAWTGANDSTSDTYDLAYTLAANVSTVGSSARIVGTVDLRVDYLLPVYDDPDGGPTNVVSAELQLAGWPWQSAGDHLVITLGATPSFAGEEKLVLGSSSTSLLTSVSASSGTPYEQMTGSSEAFAVAGTGAPTAISAVPSVAGNATGATVSVAFGSSAGEFSSLNYSAGVSVLLPTTVAGIPTIDLVAVGGTAALISGVVALGVRRARSRPSDLTFVDSEEP